jgi:hypothetical protein
MVIGLGGAVWLGVSLLDGDQLSGSQTAEPGFGGGHQIEPLTGKLREATMILTRPMRERGLPSHTPWAEIAQEMHISQASAYKLRDALMALPGMEDVKTSQDLAAHLLRLYLSHLG